ncbi:MAG: flavodoxin family protein [Armatimonadetes bacterium]|nr:flavodoxin family protein [Armatimonadota bacterium]
MRKLLGILGSPRRKGNCEILLDIVLEAVKSEVKIEKLVINELKISPCQECGGCNLTGRCIVNDDFQELYKKFKENNFFIIAAPLFFMGLPAQLKALIDRFQSLWVAKYVLKKPFIEKDPLRRGLFLSLRGQKGKDGFRCAILQLKAFFAVANINYFDELLIDKIDSKGAISKEEENLKTAVLKAKNLIQIK